MGLNDDHRRKLRIMIRNEILRFAPGLSEVEAGQAANAVLGAIGRNPLGTLEDCPVPTCACWMCVLRLQLDVLQHQAIMRVGREAEQEVD